ncbi:hypothetical protein IT396_01560 [Candidatus Nomurabacteria bacterium]|nr:hypothetical protein [Candidatus Nomurabacteria bacterium]
MAKATKKDDEVDSMAQEAHEVIEGLLQKLKSSEDEKAKIKENNEKAKGILKSAIELGRKSLLVLFFIGTFALTLYYMPKSAPTEEVAANPPAHFLLSLVA